MRAAAVADYIATSEMHQPRLGTQASRLLFANCFVTTRAVKMPALPGARQIFALRAVTAIPPTAVGGSFKCGL